ncbi:MAG: hypothetical protein ACRDHW_00915 [Ktedonobacteraceae bacterium]
MNLQRSLLCLYPRAWRGRYGDEVLAMLEQRPLSFTDGINLFFGALEAHLHPHLGTTGMSIYERILAMFATLRRSVLTIFCAFIVFILAGWGFQKMTEYDDFQQAAHMHSIVGLSFNLVVIGGAVAFLAVVAGGLPVVIAIIKSALTRKRFGPLFLLAIPILAFLVFLGSTRLLGAIDHPGTWLVAHLFPGRGLFFGTLIAAAIVSPAAVCFAVVRSEVSEKALRFALLPFTLAIISMVLILAATIIWGLGLRDSVPQLFTSNGGILSTSTVSTWLCIIIAMAIATGISMISLIRGLSARSALRNAVA